MIQTYVTSWRRGRMVDIVLVEPEIPNNTGAIARTCACTGARLHLVKPLGFDISDSAVKRAGLDYWYLVDIRVYDNLDEYFRAERRREPLAYHDKGPQELCRVRLAGRRDPHVREGDRGPARMASGEIPRPLHPHPHDIRGEEPQPLKRRCDPDIRGAAGSRASRA